MAEVKKNVPGKHTVVRTALLGHFGTQAKAFPLKTPILGGGPCPLSTAVS